MRPHAGKLIAAAIITLACACSKPPSEKEVVGEMVSWLGTADMATQAWLNQTTYDGYTRETLELSGQMLDEQKDQLARSAPRHSPAVDSAVAEAERSIGIIAGLVAARNAPDVKSQLDSLRAAKKVVLQVSDSLEKTRQ